MVSDQEGFTTPSEDISPMQLDSFIENVSKGSATTGVAYHNLVFHFSSNLAYRNFQQRL